MAWTNWFGGDAWRRMEQMQREMDRLWAATYGGGTLPVNVFPAMNVYDDGESFVVRAELPGVEPADVDISLTGKTLNLNGKRTISPAAEGERYHRRERQAGEFRRAFELPEPVDGAKVTASYSNGVLEILLPRSEQARERKIQVQ